MNESGQTDKLGTGRQIVVFLSATLVLSAPWWVLLAKYKMQRHWPLVLGLMCSPGLAGLLTSLVCGVPMRRFGPVAEVEVACCPLWMPYFTSIEEANACIRTGDEPRMEGGQLRRPREVAG